MTLALFVPLLLLSASTPEAGTGPSGSTFAPEACGKSPAASCEEARAFVERMKGAPCLVAFKAARLLYLFKDGKPVERTVDLKSNDPLIRTSVPTRIRFPVPMALSTQSVGHKLRQGDAHTPEGEYSICDRIAGSEYTFFLSLSFPSQRDVDAAVREKRFDKAALDRVKRSQRPGSCPDFNSALGGSVGIHGAPTGMAKAIAAIESRDPESINVTEADWTLGCLGLENRHIRFLAKEVKVGTKVLIVP